MVKKENRLIQLVGEKPMLTVSVDGVAVEMLWDTGSMVCLMNEKYAKEKFPSKKILSVSEFLKGDQLNLCTANNSRIEVEGVIVLKTRFGNSTVHVPFILTKDDIKEPIVGYNVIEYLSATNKEDILGSFVGMDENKAEAVISLIRRNEGVK